MFDSGLSRDVSVVSARIVNVNIRNFTVDVKTDKTAQVITDMPFSVPYTHYEKGEGSYFMPDVGALCWICFPSDGGFPFVVGFQTPVTEEGSFKANRESLEMGEQVIKGRAGNYIKIYKGGMVEVAATELCRTFYIPLEHLIRTVAKNYKAQFLGGTMEWAVAKSNSLKTPVNLFLGVKEFAEDDKYLVSIELANGSKTTEDLLDLDGVIKTDLDLKSPALKLSVQQVSDSAPGFSIEISKKGEVKIYAEKFDLTVVNDVSFESMKGNVKIKAAISQTFEAPILNLKTGNLMVVPDNENTFLATLGPGINITGSVLNIQGLLKVGEGIPLVTNKILQFLATHTHLDSTMSPTGPPVQAGSLADPSLITNKLLGI